MKIYSNVDCSRVCFDNPDSEESQEEEKARKWEAEQRELYRQELDEIEAWEREWHRQGDAELEKQEQEREAEIQKAFAAFKKEHPYTEEDLDRWVIQALRGEE